MGTVGTTQPPHSLPGIFVETEGVNSRFQMSSQHLWFLKFKNLNAIYLQIETFLSPLHFNQFIWNPIYFGSSPYHQRLLYPSHFCLNKPTRLLLIELYDTFCLSNFPSLPTLSPFFKSIKPADYSSHCQSCTVTGIWLQEENSKLCVCLYEWERNNPLREK